MTVRVLNLGNTPFESQFICQTLRSFPVVLDQFIPLYRQLPLVDKIHKILYVIESQRCSAEQAQIRSSVSDYDLNAKIVLAEIKKLIKIGSCLEKIE